MKALIGQNPEFFLRAEMASNNLEFFPDLARGVDCKQNEHHNFDTVFDHLLRCLTYSVKLTENPYLRLAVLCHDIAKPHTKSVDKQGKVHFHKHDIVGATIVYKWMKGLQFQHDKIIYVTKLVRHHQWRFQPDTKDKTIIRWLSTVGRDWYDLITLRIADRKGNLKKQHLPEITKEMQVLIDRANNLINQNLVIFEEDLAIQPYDLHLMRIPRSYHKQLMGNMRDIVSSKPEKNNREELTAYVKRFTERTTN